MYIKLFLKPNCGSKFQPAAGHVVGGVRGFLPLVPRMPTRALSTWTPPGLKGEAGKSNVLQSWSSVFIPAPLPPIPCPGRIIAFPITPIMMACSVQALASLQHLPSPVAGYATERSGSNQCDHYCWVGVEWEKDESPEPHLLCLWDPAVCMQSAFCDSHTHSGQLPGGEH